jgi:hypothetical protein
MVLKTSDIYKIITGLGPVYQSESHFKMLTIQFHPRILIPIMI